MNTVESLELKVHEFVRNVFNFVTLMLMWFTQPITTFRVVVLKDSWVPMKYMKGYFFKEEDGLIRVRSKNAPGEYHFSSYRNDFGTICEEIKYYFEK